MRVLLDENLPHKTARASFSPRNRYGFLCGVGRIQERRSSEGCRGCWFDVLVTGDTTLQYEQNLTSRKLAIVSLSANSWRIIQRHTDKIAAAVDAAVPGSFMTVDCGSFKRLRGSAEPEGPSMG